MTYRGHIQNGVVVLEGSPPLKDGTSVRVEPIEESESKPMPGSAEAIIQAVRSGAHWDGDPKDVDRFLAMRKEEKRAEVQAQVEEWSRGQSRNSLDKG